MSATTTNGAARLLGARVRVGKNDAGVPPGAEGTLCGAETVGGAPCRRWPRVGGERCRWHDGSPRVPYRIRPKPGMEGAKACRVCGRTLPLRLFPVSPATARDGTPYRRRTCQPCAEQAKGGATKRPPRTNARGDVWCCNCETYLPPTRFRRHPSRPHRWWSYCRDCTKELDRFREKRRRGTEAWRADTERRVRQKREQSRRERAQRRAFATEAIRLLRRRGFTKAEIARLARTAIQSVLAWEAGTRRVTPNAADRLGVLLRHTAAYRAGKEPEYRRRLPHPDLPWLLAATEAEMAALPLRSRWTGRDAAPERMAA